MPVSGFTKGKGERQIGLFDTKKEAADHLKRVHPKASAKEINRYYRIVPVKRYQIIRYPAGRY